MADFKNISGNIVDVVSKKIFKGEITVKNGKIESVKESDTSSENFIIPGFIDSHLHVESSMLIPSEFARIAVTHGTIGAVSDPHEIANVLGVDGVYFMIKNGKKVPFKFYFGAPSCVPATSFESSGANISSNEIKVLLADNDVHYLAEMMNFPGVVYDDVEVWEKLKAAKNANKVVDGHAPGLKGANLEKYVKAGVSTDHECFTIEEGLEKIELGMKILIREGSAAKNFDDLIDLIKDYPQHIMLCSDDKHPDDLIKGHINLLVKRALDIGYDVFDVLRSVTLNPKQHYNLDNGLLQVGDNADFVIVDNLQSLNILETFINGIRVAENGKTLIKNVEEKPINKFECNKLSASDLKVPAESNKIKVIEVIDGQLITKRTSEIVQPKKGFVDADISKDILKIVVLNRYSRSLPSIAFIRGFGLKKGAIASTIAHDSHNIIAVGTNDEDLANAINLLIDARGGISFACNEENDVLPLPFAGLMSGEDVYVVANKYETIDRKAKGLGSTLISPFMTLSFMALLVIPEIKISDKGLFDGEKFEFISLFDK
ncbi:MAG: adenine deaminase [Bacteroidetes bacterium]|nr:adenine deaminase [Bacteroidota bacterium]